MSSAFELLQQAFADNQRETFYNFAGTAILPASTVAEIDRVQRQATEPMNSHFDAWLTILEACRSDVAKLIGASSDEIAFVQNTSHGLSLVAASIDWKPGDVVLYPEEEFPSNRYVWQNLKSKGVKARAMPLAAGGSRNLLSRLQSEDLSNVRLFSFSLVSYLDGYHEPVQPLINLCQSHAALTCIDGIQGVGALPFNVQDAQPDFLACGGQKWLLGPIGTGFLYMAKERMTDVWMPQVGWASHRAPEDYGHTSFEPCDGLRRLEGGLMPIPLLAGLRHSLALLSSIDQAERMEKHRQLQDLCEGLFAGLGLVSQADPRHIFSFRLPQEKSEADIAHDLENANVSITLRDGRVRISPHFFSDPDGLTRLAGVFGAKKSVAVTATCGGTTSQAKSNAPDHGSSKKILITGGSRGLGKALVENALERGFQVWALARTFQDQVENSNVEMVELDLADPGALDAWVLEHKTLLSSMDILINNAAMAESDPFADVNEKRLQRMFAVNVLAPMKLAKACLKGMIRNRRGRIINIASSGGRCAFPLFSVYAATKGALWAWSEALGREVRQDGIFVTTVIPRPMKTSTYLRLGRKTVGRYEPDKGRQAVSVESTAQEILDAALADKDLVMSLPTKAQILLNALWPQKITRRILKHFS